MTEDEAKKNWCPFARAVKATNRIGGGIDVTIVPSCNRYTLDDGVAIPGGSLCVGSRCMAWRWIDKAGTSEAGKPNYYAGRWQGFCGLAGRP